MSNTNTIQPLSYNTFLDDIQRFKKSGGAYSDSFNFFDSPSHKYYKIFFYFGSKSEKSAFGDDINFPELSGLLAPTWLYSDRIITKAKSTNTGYFRDSYKIKEYKSTTELKPLEYTQISELEALEYVLKNKTYDYEKNDSNNSITVDIGATMNPFNYTIIENNKLVFNFDGNGQHTGTRILDSVILASEQPIPKGSLHLDQNMAAFYQTKDRIEQYYESVNAYKISISESLLEQLQQYQQQHNQYLKSEYEHNVKQQQNYLQQYKENKFHSTVDNAGYNLRRWFSNSFYNDEPYYMFNSAWSYLKLNNFVVAADNLCEFINLLSNISIESPWYFSEVTGISDALNRKVVDSRKVDFGERSKITITCLPDAFDNRIGTLLDLYRSFTMDWKNKREILPANLRKFDMAIYVFEAPDQVWHQNDSDQTNPNLARMGQEWKEAFDQSIGNTLKSIFPNAKSKKSNEDDSKSKSTPTQLINGGENFVASHKLIEFHDCEFGYNSSISGWSKLSNETGFANQYNIEISFGDCYEITYNDLMSKGFGDVTTVEPNIKVQNNLIQKRVERNDGGWLKKLGIGLLDRLNDKGLSLVKNLSFGNLYGFSVQNTLEQISNGIKNPVMAYDTIMNYAQNGKEIVDQSKKQVKGYVTTAVNTAKNTIGYSMFENEYASGKDLSDSYNISNPATMEIPSNKQVKRQNNNDSNNYVNHVNQLSKLVSDDNINNNNIIRNNVSQVRQELGSDDNIADNNILPTEKSQFYEGNIFENYTKNKVIRSTNNGGNIFKPSTIANNL